MISNLPYYASFRDYLQTERSEKTVVLFCKSLYVFLILKIIFLWPALHDLVTYSPFQFTSAWRYVIYAPIKLAQWNLDVFLIGLVLILIIVLRVGLNYFTSALIFWLSFCISRLTGTMANGSDSILNLFLLLAIGFSDRPAFKAPSLRSSQSMVSNFVLFLCRIQLALIYLLSGFDKLTSDAWRSGDAIYSIMNLEYFSNPTTTFYLNESICAVLAWGVILFELGFPFLIWFRRFRFPILAMGICFHIGIIFFLSLPDFGVIMIMTYLLFVPNSAAGKWWFESRLPNTES